MARPDDVHNTGEYTSDGEGKSGLRHDTEGKATAKPNRTPATVGSGAKGSIPKPGVNPDADF